MKQTPAYGPSAGELRWAGLLQGLRTRAVRGFAKATGLNAARLL